MEKMLNWFAKTFVRIFFDKNAEFGDEKVKKDLKALHNKFGKPKIKHFPKPTREVGVMVDVW